MRGYAQASNSVSIRPDVAKIQRTAHFKEQDTKGMRPHLFFFLSSAYFELLKSLTDFHET
jgi:hypothetical protein